MRSGRRLPIVLGWTLTALVSLGASACWLSQKGPKLPDLSEQQNETAQRVHRLERIESLMTRDLETFEKLRVRVFETPESFYASPFPLDLFKHVAMECLNESWSPGRAESSNDSADRGSGDQDDRVGAAAEFDIACRSAHLDRLVERLEGETPDKRDEALAKIAQLDEMRRLRSKLRNRIGKMEQILQLQRNYLANQRAELRRVQESLKRRRTEFPTGRWNTAQDRVRARARRLDELQTAIDSLAASWPRWPERLERNVRTLYFDLSKLSRRQVSWRN